MGNITCSTVLVALAVLFVVYLVWAIRYSSKHPSRAHPPWLSPSDLRELSQTTYDPIAREALEQAADQQEEMDNIGFLLD